MIPIADNLPSRSRPIVNYGLIGFNMVLFLWELKLEATGKLSQVLNSWGIVPDRIATVTTDAFTQGNPAAVVALFVFYSSLLSAMFFHGSVSQLLGNLLFLWVFGKSVEDKVGHRRYLALYLISGVLIEIGQILAEPTLTVPLVGANGAIATILGAYYFSFPQAKIETILPLAVVFLPIELPILFYLFWWFVQQLFYGIGSLNVAGGINPMGTAYWMHGVGLILGAVLVKYLGHGKKDPRAIQ